MRLAVLIVLLPALLAGRAATASNTVPAVQAGSGSGAVSGYTISSVSYSLAGDAISGVSFALSPSGAATAKVRPAPGEAWAACTLSGDIATCPLSVAVTAAISLEIVAAG